MFAKVRLVIAILGITMIAGCSMSSTSLTQVWTDPSISGGSVGKTLVIGMARAEASRRLFENEMSALFGQKGLEAVSSHTLLPTLPEANDSGKESVRSAIAGKGFDTVIVTRLLDIDTQTTYVPGETRVVADHWGHPNDYRLYSYYDRTYTVVHDPGYIVEDKIVRLETNVYDVASESLIWAAVSETFNPSSIEDAVRTFGAAVLEDLEKSMLLK
jgi:hypothetical protein